MISNQSNIINLNTNQKTMSSLDLFQIVQSERIGNDESSIRLNDFHNRVADELKDDNYEIFVVKNKNGTQTTAFNLSFDQCLLVGMRESRAVRKGVLIKLKELEDNQKPIQQFTLPTNFIEALECLVTSEKEKAVALQVIEDQKPAMLVYDRLADRKTDVSTTVLAKHLGITATKLNKFLREQGVKFIKRDLPTAKYSEWFNIISDSKNGHDYSQCLITDLGFIEITKLWGDQ